MLHTETLIDIPKPYKEHGFSLWDNGLSLTIKLDDIYFSSVPVYLNMVQATKEALFKIHETDRAVTIGYHKGNTHKPDVLKMIGDIENRPWCYLCKYHMFEYPPGTDQLKEGCIWWKEHKERWL